MYIHSFVLLLNKQGKCLPNHRKGSGVWEFFSSAFFALLLSGKNSAALWEVLPNTLQVTFLQANQENQQLSFIDGSCYVVLVQQVLLQTL